MNESDLIQRITNKIVELKVMRMGKGTKNMMISIWKVIEILEELLEVNQNEKDNRANKTIN